jgi:arylsulfatase
MPHIPLFVGEAFRGKSGRGIYGDVVAEVDASVGAVLDVLDRTGRADDTLVIFTSDNGPWLRFGAHGGSAGPLREGKGTVFEGGIREPCVARLPGVIPAGSISGALLASIDILPTVAALTGDPLPVDPAGHCLVAGKRIDGHDRRAAFTATEPASVSDGVTHWYHYRTGELQAVRRGRWKLLLPHKADSTAGQEPGRDGRMGKTAPLTVGRELYDLEGDPGERHDVAARHPEIVAALERVAEAARAELGDALTGRAGAGVRPPGGVVKPPRPKPAPVVPPATGKSGRRPNVIYVMTDDQGYGDIAAHGNPVIRTPHLDRLWRESVRFTEFHASPTCAPTRAALLTGRHEFRSGVTHTIFERERLALSATTLPQLLQAAGYTTGIFGKWHLGDEDEYQPGHRGFDRVFIHGAGGIGQTFPGSCGDVPGNSYFDPWIRSDGTFVKTRGYCTDVFFAAALEWIDSCRTQGKPFFCAVTPNAPHDPLDCPVGSDAPSLAPLAAAGIADAKQRERIAKFYGMIENIDANMGRLLVKLDEWGLAEDTLVVFTTDNGTATGAAVCNDGMRGHKGSPWRGGTRVPAFWRWPGTLPAGIDVPAVVAHIDVLPTLCELTATAIPADVAAKVEGRSLVPLLHDATAAWPDRPLVTHVGRWDRGKAAGSALRNCRIREGRWSLVNVKNDPQAWELYDLATDPGEARDVAADHADVVARLAATYGQWWHSVQGDLVNEDRDGPAENPFKTAFHTQQAGKAGRHE